VKATIRAPIITLFAIDHGGFVKVRATVIFRGRVQGVFFRANCEMEAERLGLSGYVRNLANGDVEAIFEGERGLVEEAIEWNKTSQPNAVVRDTEIEWSEATGEFEEFARR
jgi:acylphosphatase